MVLAAGSKTELAHLDVKARGEEDQEEVRAAIPTPLRRPPGLPSLGTRIGAKLTSIAQG